MSASAPYLPYGHWKNLSRVVIAVLALYAMLIHAIALDAGKLSYSANSTYIMIDICQPAVSGDPQSPAAPASHTVCAWMCAAGACGATGPVEAYPFMAPLAFVQLDAPKAWEKLHTIWRNTALLGARAPPVA